MVGKRNDNFWSNPGTWDGEMQQVLDVRVAETSATGDKIIDPDNPELAVSKVVAVFPTTGAGPNPEDEPRDPYILYASRIKSLHSLGDKKSCIANKGGCVCKTINPG